MNKLKSILTLSILILCSVLIYTSCKKDKESIKETPEVVQKRNISIDANGIATITTMDGKVSRQKIRVQSSKQEIFLSKLGVAQDSLGKKEVYALPVSLPTSLLNTPFGKSSQLAYSSLSSSESGEGGGSGYPVIIFYATVYHNSCLVLLDSYYKTSGEYAVSATIYNKTCIGSCVSWSVVYHWTKNGVGIGTTTDSFSRC